jgi:molybdate transport system regulatory protein
MARLSIRIDLLPEGRIGPGKITLLERIAEHGSIAAAGRSMAMSYRRAWELVAETAMLLGAPVVEAQTGGRHGGKASLTPLGEELVRRYRAAEAEAARAVSRELDALQRAADRARKTAS